MVAEQILSDSTKVDIDKRVTRILNDLGNPAPPINHELVRELIKLDREYFQKDDPTILSELWSRLKRGTKQLIQRPSLLADMLRDMSLRAAYVPDAKRIYIDGSLHPMKKRWGETHECIHGILPWHKDYMLGDTKHTLSQQCREKLEAEANYGTGRLLFLGDKFNQKIADLPCSLKTVSLLKKIYGNSLTSTLWRIVESTNSVPVCAYISPNNNSNCVLSDNIVGSDVHFVRSPLFVEKFYNISESHVKNIINTYINHGARYNTGNTECLMEDANGDAYEFYFETINNTYAYLTLCVGRRHRSGLVVNF